MTAHEIYEMLDQAGVDFEVIQVFDGSRFIQVKVEEESD
jgi:hypothetical protein